MVVFLECDRAVYSISEVLVGILCTGLLDIIMFYKHRRENNPSQSQTKDSFL